MIMNGASYDALSDADKAFFAEATESAAQFFIKEIAKLEGEHQGVMETEYGVTFATPTDTQRAAFAAKFLKQFQVSLEVGYLAKASMKRLLLRNKLLTNVTGVCSSVRRSSPLIWKSSNASWNNSR